MRLDYLFLGFFSGLIGWFIYSYFWMIISNLIYYKRRIWNVRIKFWWHCLYYRKDEFHSSLDKDPCAWMVMTDQERKKYDQRLTKRRWKAHQRDLNQSDKLVK